MYDVIESASVDRRAIPTPGHGSDWTTEFEYRHWFFPRVISPFPHANSAIIARRGKEFDPCTTCECPVKRVDDLAVGAKFAYALTGG
jgi:hypothetical protein